MTIQKHQEMPTTKKSAHLHLLGFKHPGFHPWRFPQRSLHLILQGQWWVRGLWSSLDRGSFTAVVGWRGHEDHGIHKGGPLLFRSWPITTPCITYVYWGCNSNYPCIGPVGAHLAGSYFFLVGKWKLIKLPLFWFDKKSNLWFSHILVAVVLNSHLW